MSEALEDLVPLTPSLFLQEIYGDASPEWNFLSSSELQKKHQRLFQLRRELRHRFRKEYFGLLSNRWKSGKRREFQEGDIVLIELDNKRQQWEAVAFGWILEKLSGWNGVVRIVRLKTRVGTLIRPIQRIYPMKLYFEEDSVPVTHVDRERAASKAKKDKEKIKSDLQRTSTPAPVITKS
jgi:hypothetical protein